VGGQGLVDLAGDVALEAAHDLSGGLALAGAPGYVGLGARVGGHPGEDDPPEDGVGLAVPAAVEAVAALLAGGGVDWADAAQRGEARLGAHPGRVVADGDQQRGRDAGAHACPVPEPGRGGVLNERFQCGV